MRLRISAEPIRFALDADGYASVLAPTAKGYVVEPGQVGAALVDYFATGLATDAPTGPFAPVRLATDVIRGLRSYRDSMARQGYSARLGFTPRSFAQARDGGLQHLDATIVRLFDLMEQLRARGPRRSRGAEAACGWSEPIGGADQRPRPGRRRVGLVPISTRPPPAHGHEHDWILIELGGRPT